MLKIRTYLIIMVALLVSCTGSGDGKDTAQTDHSYLAGDQRQSAIHAGFEQAKGVADSLYSRMQFRDAYNQYLQLLDNKEVKADSEKRLNVLNSLCMTSELSGHKAEQAKWLHLLLDLATQTGNDYYHSMALITMGQNVFYEGDHEQGIRYVSEAVDLMAKTNRKDTDHLMNGHLIMLARLYGEMKDYDNALKTNERNLRLTMEGSRWGDVPNQQLIDRRMALAKMAAVLAQMGRSVSGRVQSMYFQRADSAYAAWKAVQYEGNHTRDYFIVDYLKRRGLYQEAVPIYNDLIQRVRQQGDTLGEMMNTAKWGLADICQKMGRYQQAADLYEQVLVIQDTLKSRKARNSAQELAAVYHAKEQEQIIMQKNAENSRQEAIIIIVLLVLTGVAALAVVVIVKNRDIHRKNRLLAQQIADAVKYKKMYWDEKRSPQPQVPVPADSDLSTLSDEQFFRYIDDIVISEQLFLDPNFGRQTIMDRFQLSKERVGNIFSKGSKHAKMSNYIQQLRLDYAAHQLVKQPEKSIIQIAADCGFSSNTYFSDRFRQHFGMSPSDFRREALEQNVG